MGIRIEVDMESLREKIGNVIIDKTYCNSEDIYNEGDDEENLVLETFKNDRDVLDVLREENRWPILYQLSPDRENILLTMDLRKTDRVLEIGAGMGAVTGGISKRVSKVDCIDISERRCLANAWRNKKFDNITIYVGNFQSMDIKEEYDVVTLIGVLEYAAMFYHEENPDVRMLEKVKKCLKPGGRLYIAIENRLGMKYFSGAQEDHLASPYVGIQGYSGKTATTYSRAELTSLLELTGWDHIYFYYPYPDYKLPQVIYSDDIPSGDFLPDISDYNLPRFSSFNEMKAMKSLSAKEDWKTFSNSFLVEVNKPL